MPSCRGLLHTRRLSNLTTELLICGDDLVEHGITDHRAVESVGLLDPAAAHELVLKQIEQLNAASLLVAALHLQDIRRLNNQRVACDRAHHTVQESREP